VALTFMDLVDEELLELAREEMRELLERTPLAGAPVIPVSNVTGQGRDEILQALEAFSPRARDQEAPFRLPVDRVFTRHGHGTVVSGTVLSGAVQEGETAGLAPGGLSARVRGIQVHGQKVPRAFAGQRAALNLSLSRTEVERGLQVISPGQVPETRLLDVRYRHLPDAPPLRDLELVRFLIGTADVLARIRTLGVDRIPPQEEEPGRAWEGYVQLRLQEPVAALPGDRFVLRRPSPTRTLGGGSVLDPWAHPIHKREAKKTLAQLRALAAGDRSVLLLRAGRAGLSLVEARIRGVEGVIVADRVLHPGIVASVEEEIRTAVAIFHEANPLLPGCGRAELRGASLRKLGDRVIEGLLARMAERGVLARAGNLFRLTDFKVRLSSEMEAARARVLHAARDASRTALETESLLQQAVSPRARELLALMTARGELVAVGPFLMDRATANALVEEARGWLAREGSFTTAQAKDWTGLTRKHLIPILEWLDATQVTRRVGEQRKAFR
jgi:selenocysteine-specific elongation factor